MVESSIFLNPEESTTAARIVGVRQVSVPRYTFFFIRTELKAIFSDYHLFKIPNSNLEEKAER